MPCKHHNKWYYISKAEKQKHGNWEKEFKNEPWKHIKKNKR